MDRDCPNNDENRSARDDPYTRPAQQLQEIIDAATAKRVAALMDAIDYDAHQRETAAQPTYTPTKETTK